MIILTPEEMRAVDKRAIEAGFPELLLMEIAGRAVAEKAGFILEEDGHGHHHPGEAKQDFSNQREREVLVIAGKGNNGGDGLVAARYLDMWGFSVKIILLAEEDDLTESTLTNYNLCKLRDIEILSIRNPAGYREEIANLMNRADLVIDALLGTGIKGTVKEPYSGLIRMMNSLAFRILAVDIPSGIDGRTGAVMGEAVQADYTLTMAFPKIGLVVYPGREHCGDIEIVDLGIPLDLVLAEKPAHFMLDEEEVRFLLPERPGDSHKGTFGRVGVIGGSAGMSGAPFLSAFAALKVGAGLVRVAVPEEIQSIVAAYSPELMTLGLESLEGPLTEKNIERVNTLMEESTVLAVGPGLGTSPGSRKLVSKILREFPGPLVLDADGINSLESLDLLAQKKGTLILTPHPGEMARLTGRSSREIQASRIETARTFAAEHGVYLILKGAATVIAFPDGVIYLNPSGNDGMATAGSGDVLTGILAGLLASGVEVEDAVVLAPYLHGLAGDLAASELTTYSMTAGDIIAYLGKAITYPENGH